MVNASTRLPASVRAAARGVVSSSSSSSSTPNARRSSARSARERVVLLVTKRSRWPSSRNRRIASAAPSIGRPETWKTPSTSRRMAAMERESIRVSRSVSIPLSEIAFRYSRSSGPGGQHAQKSETRVEALFDVESSAALTDRQKNRVVRKAGPILRAVAQDERSQARNRRARGGADRRRVTGSASRRAPSGRHEAGQGRGRTPSRAEAPEITDEASASASARLNAVDQPRRRPRLTTRFTFDPDGSTTPGRRLCARTMPFLRLPV